MWRLAARKEEGRGGPRRNKMKKREVRPRKFNEGVLRGVTRPPRGANPTVSGLAQVQRRGQRVGGHLTVSTDEDGKCPRCAGEQNEEARLSAETRSADCHWRRLNKL